MFPALLAQHVDNTPLSQLLDPRTLSMMIPIVAIVIFGGTALVAAVFRHRERMRMIEMGIHPDSPAVEEEDPTAVKPM